MGIVRTVNQMISDKQKLYDEYRNTKKFINTEMKLFSVISQGILIKRMLIFTIGN